MTMNSIPARATSKYAGQYARAFDSQRIVEIFADSHKIALSSKNPETARDRFALAVEAYHQIMSMPVSGDVRSSIHDAMVTLVDHFPAQLAANESLGLREKARKLKTVSKRLDLLRQARDILQRAANADPTNDVIRNAVAELRDEIADAEAAAKGL
jgi:thioredoxin-like negative regulator of GroEL